MKKKNLKKNYVFNLTYQILLLVAQLITTPYLSRVLEPDGVGTVSYAESVISYFVLFATLGITILGQREISYCQDDRAGRSSVFWDIKSLQILTSTAALIVYLVFSVLQNNHALYLVLGFEILAVTFDVVWLFQGLEEFGQIVLRNIIFKLLSILYIFTFVRTKDDVVKYAFGVAFFMFISNAALWVRIGRYVDKPDLRSIRPFRDIRSVITLFLPTVAIQIYTVLDKTMIGVITHNAFENGYYEQAIKVSKMVLTGVTSLGAVVAPRIGYHFERGETEEVKHYMYNSYRFVWFMGIPLYLGLAGVAPNFVPWFFGPGYDMVVLLLQILGALIIIIGLSNVTGIQYMVPTKRQNLLTVTVTIGACVNFVLNMILIFKFGSLGAAIASVLAEFTVTVSQFVLVRKELSVWKIVGSSRNYVIAGVLMFAVIKTVGVRLTSSIVNTVVMVAVGGLSYMIGLTVLRDEFFISNMKNIKNKLIHH